MSLTKLINANQEQLESYVSKFDKRLEKIFKKINRMATAEIVTADIDDTLDFDIVWADILQESGYNQLVQRYVNTLDDMNGSINKILDEAGLLTTLTDDQKHRLDVMKQLQIKDLQKIGMDRGIAMKQGLYNNILAGRTKADLLEAMESELEGSKYKSYSKTYASTGINDYRQAVINQRVEEFKDDEDVVWVYEGNDVDSATRDFCKHILKANKAYSTSEKNKLESDKRRKWNCRHTFIPMYKEDAQEEGYKVEGTVEKKEEAKKIKDIKVPKKTKVKKIEVPEIDFGYKGKFNKHLKVINDDAKIVINKMPLPESIIVGKGSYYPSTKTVSAPRGNSHTFRHEYGHYVDNMLSKEDTGFYSTKRLSKASTIDATSLGLYVDDDIEDWANAVEKRDKALRAFTSEFVTEVDYIAQRGRRKGQRIGIKYHTEPHHEAISDIIDSMSDGWFHDKYNGYGHGGRYYYDDKKSKMTENFANLFEIWGDTDKRGWTKAIELFPNLTKEFELIMREVQDGKLK